MPRTRSCPVSEMEISEEFYPERDLVSEVLKRAVRDVLNITEGHEGYKDFEDAYAWLRLERKMRDADALRPFTFQWCCGVLDLDPNRVRRNVLDMLRRGVRI